MLSYTVRGSGLPILAIHGWTPDHRLMSGCLEPLFADRPGYRRIYPDLPGMGRSAAPAAIASSDDVHAALLEFVDATIGAEPFLVVGESYGGYQARALTRARPDQVRGLALICPIGIAVEHAYRRRPPHTVMRPDPELMAGLDELTAEQYGEIAVVQSVETLRRFREDVQPGLEVADEIAMARIRENWTLSESPESGPAYAGPTLILTGRQDDTVGYEDQYALLPHYPRATFVVLDVAGHNLQIEQPVLFGALMHEWLDRVAYEYPADAE